MLTALTEVYKGRYPKVGPAKKNHRHDGWYVQCLVGIVLLGPAQAEILPGRRAAVCPDAILPWEDSDDVSHTHGMCVNKPKYTLAIERADHNMIIRNPSCSHYPPMFLVSYAMIQLDS